MCSAICLLLLTLIGNLSIGHTDGREIFLHQNGPKSSSADKLRSASLIALLHQLSSDYLQDCVIGLVYDWKSEISPPPDLRQFLGPLALTSFKLESADTRGNERLRGDKCINYLLFLDEVGSAGRVLARRDLSDSKIVLVTAQSAWEVKDFLKSDLAHHHPKLLVICHSSSRRSGHGTYLLYTNKLYADGSGASQPLLLASWKNCRLSRHSDPFKDKLSHGFMGHRLLVSVAENPPFAMRRWRMGQEDGQWDGLEVRLVRLAGNYLNLSVEFTEPRSRLTASLEAAKADVAQGISSMAIGGIYHTLDLTGAFDTTTPHQEDCASFISLASSALPKYRAVLGPFQLSVWLMLIVSYLSLIVPLSFNSHYSIVSLLKHPSRLSDMFWYVFSTYTNSFVVKSPLLDYGIAKNSSTLLLGVYWVFTIIVTACYTGSIVAFITLPVFPEAMEQAEDFAYYRYRIGTLDHNGWDKWFNASETDENLLKRLFRKVEHVPTVLEGVRNASRAYFWPYAFLASRTALDYLVQTDFAPSYSTKRSLMHVSSECFVRYQVVQLLPANSLYTAKMNKFVSRAKEHGLLDHIVNDVDWQVQRIATIAGKKITKGLSQAVHMEDRVLSVEDTQGMFLVLGSGVLMALLSLSFERIHSWKKARKQQSPFEHYPQAQRHFHRVNSITPTLRSRAVSF